VAKVETHLTEEEKQAWKEFCRSENLKEAEMLRILIKQVLPKNNILDGNFLHLKSVFYNFWSP